MIKYLKPKHFIAAAAMFALTSCSQDDVIDTGVEDTNKPREIEFTVDMLSRATDRTVDNLDTIWVFADNGTEQVFDFTPFIKDEYGRFIPETKQYWPDGAASVNFTAVYPDPTKMNITKTPGNLTLAYSENSYANRHYDLVTASKTVAKQEYNGSIPLEFRHAFAQIEIRAKIGPESDFKVDAYAVSIVEHSKSGTLDLTTNTWTKLYAASSYDTYTAPKEVFTVSEEAKSLTDLWGNIYIPAQTRNSPQYNVSPVKSSGVRLRFYGIVKDKETDTLLYGTDAWASNSAVKKVRTPDQNDMSKLYEVRNLDKCGISNISLSTEPIEFKAGTKYVFTVDFTNGIGYLSYNDPLNPYGPCVPNKMSANVTVEDWTTTDFNSNAN
ncbi:MAG: fimbrillin family protein [Muribaculaceae bacterium]|nr:fimbrillin family protein [Muribaculaceae bacterium]